MAHEGRFDAALLHAQSLALLTTWGFADQAAATAADALSYADLGGIDSHGISMFVSYERAYAEGRLDVTATPVVVRETPGTTLLDAGHGLGHPAGVLGMERAIAHAETLGVGVCVVRHSHHFGAAGFYSSLASAAGMVGIAMTTARSTAVLPTGGAEPRLPTNPLSFAAPAGRHDDVVLDMSTSTVAINRIKVLALQGKPLPPGWFLDGSGHPVTDADAALDSAWHGSEGGITALGGPSESGGHKGYGLAVMVQLLSAALSGGSFAATRGPEEPDNIGHFFLAIDPGAFRPDGGFTDSVAEVVDALHATRPVPGGEVLVAGEPEARARRERSELGVPLPASLVQRLRDICTRTGAPFLLAP